MASGDASAAVPGFDRPWRLSHRQCPVRRGRNADRGARLGARDARRSGRGFLLSRDAVGDARRRRGGARRPRPRRARHPRARRDRGALLGALGRPRRRPARLVFRL